MSERDLADTARAALEDLLGGGPALSVETLKSVIGKGTQQGHGERVKANARTVTYKLRRTLDKEPESEDVTIACGYLLLGMIEQYPAGSEDAQRQLVHELEVAGFDEERSREAIARLARGVRERRADWHRRLKQRRIRRLVAALQGETQDTRTG